MSAAPQLNNDPSMTVVANPTPWTTRDIDVAVLHSTGDTRFLAKAARAAMGAADPLDGIAQYLSKATGFGAGILCWNGHTLAFTDHCRSTPVFHSDSAVGGDAHAVLETTSQTTRDTQAVLSAATAGYVAGRRTLYKGLSQVRPGEAVHWDATGTMRSKRAFVYSPDTSATSPDDPAAALTESIDAAIDRVIEAAAGAPVWVPLSGGLDSRLSLAKLAARGCANLHSFSYGPRGNADAMVARDIAARLEVPWRFIATPAKDVREFFAGATRRDYWAFADGLCATPNNQDLLPLIRLRESGALSDDAIIVNGQTGDFISGGHVPDVLFDNPTTVDTLIDRIIGGHHALWHSLLTDEHRQTLHAHVRDVLDLDSDGDALLDPRDAIVLWERYEYEGRQAAYIVNGQRIYDFLGLRWALPLWDGEVVRFWRDADPALKRSQRLYRETWNAWDHKGVFSLPTRQVTAWSRPVSAVLVPVSIATRLVAGRARRDRWMTCARYFDRFGNHYQAFGWKHFRRHAADARNPLAFYTRAWFAEREIAWPGPDVAS